MKIFKYSRKEAQKNGYNDQIVFHPISYVLMPIMLSISVVALLWLFIPFLRSSITYILLGCIGCITLVVLLLKAYMKKEAWCKTVFVIYKNKLYMIKKITSYDEGFYTDVLYEYEENGYTMLADVTRLYGAVLYKNNKSTFWCEYDDYEGSVCYLEIPNAFHGLKFAIDSGYINLETLSSTCDLCL